MGRDGRSVLTALALGVLVAMSGGQATAEEPTQRVRDPADAFLGYPTQVQLAQADAMQDDVDDDVNDPLEPVNRLIFGFNQAVEVMLLRPLATAYTAFLPLPVREAIGNALHNLRTPVILANDILQGEPDRAWTTTQRFLVNSTLGVGGLSDPASEMGLPKHSEDFGQTLAVWGVGEIAYLVLPILGPSNPRDAVGQLLVDSYFDPLALYLNNTDREEVVYALAAARGVHAYSNVMDELAQLKKTSVDYYAAIRSLYRQNRRSEIANGEVELDLPQIPDITERPGYGPWVSNDHHLACEPVVTVAELPF